MARGGALVRLSVFCAGVLCACCACLVGCSALDPAVGAQQGSCGLPPGSGGSTGSSSGYPGSTSGQTMATGTCPGPTGNACDDCESAWCCTQLVACYQDPVCACADLAVDQCKGDAGPDSSTTGACWDSFVASGGPVEAARYACLKAWCASECAVW
jgi:hypothetical protein